MIICLKLLLFQDTHRGQNKMNKHVLFLTKKNNSKRAMKENQYGVTLIEIILAVLFMSFLLGSANSIMSYSRQETERGFWLQKTIIELRNGVRLIGQKLKSTSYPSTVLIDLSNRKNDKVLSYKIKREFFKASGRLKSITLNPRDDFDMHAMVTGGSNIVPLPNDQQIMYFPICEPEIDPSPGKITWVELILKPASDYNLTGSGDLYIVEHQDDYKTYGDDRAFGITNKKFSKSLPIIREKKLISSIGGISIDTYSTKEKIGEHIVAGVPTPEYRERILVTLTISCRHPKDRNTWLSDQCAIINHVDLVEVPVTSIMELVSVNVAAGTANILVDGQPKSCTVGGAIGGYKVVKVIPDAVVLRLSGAKFDRYVTKRIE